MRKIIWSGLTIPEDMTFEQFVAGAHQLAKLLGGELVKFGNKSFFIIGDERAQREYNRIAEKLKIPYQTEKILT